MNRNTTLFLLAGAGLLILGGGVMGGSIVERFAKAIAEAEGFYVAGSIPNRQNNPGDLKSGGVIATYPTVSDGWQALYIQVDLMLNGGSAYYDPSMTIREAGDIYSGGDPNWATNVANTLGVSPDTRLQDLT